MVSYSLRTPVEHGGKTFKELSFRKPKTGDLMVLDNFKGEMSKTIALLATISDVPLPAFKEVEMEDLNAIIEATAGLLGNGQATTGV